MYKRIVIALIELVAVFIVASLLPRGLRHTPPPVAAPRKDAGLSRRLDRVLFNGITRREALAWVHEKAHVNLAISPSTDFPGDGPMLELPVTLDLKNVTVETTLRLIFEDTAGLGDVDGEFIIIGDDRSFPRRVYAFDVRDLVSPPTTAGIPNAPRPGTPFNGRYEEDWYGVDGIHTAPRDLTLPPLNEADLASTLNAVLGFHDENEMRWGFGLVPAGQMLPGRLVGSLMPGIDVRIAEALEQLRHPLSLAANEPPPELALDRPLPELKLTDVPFAQAIEKIRSISGTRIVLQTKRWNGGDMGGVPVSARTMRNRPLGEAIALLIDQLPASPGGGFRLTETDGVVYVDLAGEGRTINTLRVYDVRQLLAHHDGWLSTPPPTSSGDSPAPTAEQWEADSLMRRIYLDYRTGNWNAEESADPGSGVMRDWRGRLLMLNEPEAQHQAWLYLRHIYQTGKPPE